MRYIAGRKATQELGISQTTLRRYADSGRIPFIRTASGQRRYNVDAYVQRAAATKTVCYCRVSPQEHRADLQRQIQFMSEHYPGADIISDIGSGIGFRRKGLATLLERLHQGEKLHLVVTHQDRLANFGFELIQWMVEQNGGEISVLDDAEHCPRQELTADLLDILEGFAYRLHALRSHRNAIRG